MGNKVKEEILNADDCRVERLVSVPVEVIFEAYPPGSFPAELEDLINKHSIEGGSDTPDFILAEYLRQCLNTFDMCVRRRESWYGRRTG